MNNEKLWKEILFKDEENYSHFNAATAKTKIDDNGHDLILLSLLLRKYPELRATIAEYRVKTEVYDLDNLAFKQLTEPQELSFLEYILHVIQPLTYPLHAGILTSFLERGTVSYVLEYNSELLTSHEYFGEIVIQQSLKALSKIVLDASLDNTLQYQLQFVYTQTIRSALRTQWLNCPYANRANKRVITEIEAIVTKGVMQGRFLNNLFGLFEILRIQIHEQICQAFMHLDENRALARFPYQGFDDFTPEEYRSMRSVIYYDHDYAHLDDYLGKDEGDLISASSENLPQQVHTSEEKKKTENTSSIEADHSHKCLLLRAVLQGKNLDYKHAFNLGSPYYANCLQQISDDILSLLIPEETEKKNITNPFVKVFGAYREEINRVKQGDVLYCDEVVVGDTQMSDLSSSLKLKFSGRIEEKTTAPIK